jgi:hypothetical protein
MHIASQLHVKVLLILMGAAEFFSMRWKHFIYLIDNNGPKRISP